MSLTSTLTTTAHKVNTAFFICWGYSTKHKNRFFFPLLGRKENNCGPQGLACEARQLLMWPEGVIVNYQAVERCRETRASTYEEGWHPRCVPASPPAAGGHQDLRFRSLLHWTAEGLSYFPCRPFIKRNWASLKNSDDTGAVKLQCSKGFSPASFQDT